MSTPEECCCCTSVAAVNEKVISASIKCITEHEGFIVNCLNNYVLRRHTMNTFKRMVALGRINLFTSILYRYIAYDGFGTFLEERVDAYFQLVLL
ncbi:hypothetical protein KUTeg_002813 [Tegillarca granosa]|uniref:Uncharacterized protein n=1 Tax=Tegillarca granosa TaxID=220873 RepID=A0ABQ9FVA3_TEGGR|nr:hypothetical protein KUTeg_002813 [Tegillarca granosa]